MSYTVDQFRKDLEDEFAWPGGYQRYFITSDGEALSFDAAKEMQAEIEEAITEGVRDGWMVVGCEINYEDESLICGHTNKPIPAAYGEG